MHARLAGVLGGPEGVAYPPVKAAERRERIGILRELAGLVAEEERELARKRK